MEKAKAHAISIFIFISILLLLLFGGRAIILWQIDVAITTSLANLKEQGIEISFHKKNVELWNKNVSFDEAQVKFSPPHWLAPSSCSIQKIRIVDIFLIPLIAKKEIIVGQILLTKPKVIVYYLPADSLHSVDAQVPKFTAKIGELKVDSLTLQVKHRASAMVTTKASVSLSIKKLTIFTTNVLSWTASEIDVRNIRIELPTLFYKIQARQLTFTSSKKLLHLDSLELTPTLSKWEFAKRSIYQTDQITVVIPSLVAHQFTLSETVNLPSYASSVKFNFQLQVFHDNRFPQAYKNQMMLPSRFMHQLGFPIQIDTVQILSSFISYDEFPIAGVKSGRIFFNNLKATISNISTTHVGETRMRVESRFMDAGNLTTTFTFPLALNKPYTVKGTLRDFDLPAVNQMLTPLEHIRILKGNLKAMDFQFQYNEQNASGAVVLNYSNLKVSILRKNKRNRVNTFTSFVVNALLNDTMDKTVAEAKRTGSIKFTRNATEGIFGFWWKSLREGIKSVFKVHKIKK